MNTQRLIKEVIEHGDSVTIKGLTVAGRDYDLHISNDPGQGRLSLRFSKPNLDTNEFAIRVHEGKLSFSRTLWRPDHDHDDNETLQVVNGEPRWYSRFPYSGEGRTFFEIPFGSASE